MGAGAGATEASSATVGADVTAAGTGSVTNGGPELKGAVVSPLLAVPNGLEGVVAISGGYSSSVALFGNDPTPGPARVLVASQAIAGVGDPFFLRMAAQNQYPFAFDTDWYPIDLQETTDPADPDRIHACLTFPSDIGNSLFFRIRIAD